jgi:hypothetical protein
MLLSAVHVLRVPTRMKQVLCCTQKCASFQIAVHTIYVGEKVRVRVVDFGIPRDLRFGRLREVLGALILNKKHLKKKRRGRLNLRLSPGAGLKDYGVCLYLSNHQAFFLEYEVVMYTRIKDDFNVKTFCTVHRW